MHSTLYKPKWVLCLVLYFLILSTAVRIKLGTKWCEGNNLPLLQSVTILPGNWSVPNSSSKLLFCGSVVQTFIPGVPFVTFCNCDEPPWLINFHYTVLYLTRALHVLPGYPFIPQSLSPHGTHSLLTGLRLWSNSLPYGRIRGSTWKNYLIYGIPVYICLLYNHIYIYTVYISLYVCVCFHRNPHVLAGVRRP